VFEFARSVAGRVEYKAALLGVLVGLGLATLSAGCSRSKDKVVNVAPDDPESKDKVVNVAADDQEMNAAIAKARATLPVFWKSFERPGAGEDSFGLKVRISDSNGTEHFWVVEIEKKNGKIFGEINNDPETVKSVKLGQRIEVRDDQISDWTFTRNGKIVGNHTLRPLLKKMPSREANRLRSMLEEP
jgi:uncharacterized protein YegJ (DUF2314 family)